jgi:hypothetical protein
MEGLQEKTTSRIYFRRIKALKKGLASEETMIWVWVGMSSVGHVGFNAEALR